MEESVLYVVLEAYERGSEVKYFSSDNTLRDYLMKNIVSYLEEEGEQDQIPTVDELCTEELVNKAIEFGKKMMYSQQGCWVVSVDILKTKSDGKYEKQISTIDGVCATYGSLEICGGIGINGEACGCGDKKFNKTM
jgi:hypothetical protein